MPPRATRYSVAGNPREESRQWRPPRKREKERESSFFPRLFPAAPTLTPVTGGPRSYATGHSVDVYVCIRSHELRFGVYAPNHAAVNPVDLLSGVSESVISVVAELDLYLFFFFIDKTIAEIVEIYQVTDS